jgi:predicted DNA-binding transcriptional regulator AlpA
MSDKWLTGPQVMAHFSVCDTTLFRWQRDPAVDFPRPMIIRRRRYWRESDIERWAQHRMPKDVLCA